MSSEFFIAIIGGFIGGILGVIGTLISSYYGPRKIEEWRELRQEERINGPRKRLLKQLLEDSRFEDGRTLHEIEYAQPGREPRRAGSRQHVIGAGHIIAERFRRVGA